MVGGVLGAAASLRLWSEFGLRGIPWHTEYLRDFGFWLLLMPIAWITLAMSIHHWDRGEVIGYFSGWLMICGLLALI